jgi:di/tricarboxylate transporter
MIDDASLTFALLAALMALFVWDRLRVDAVALLGVLALTLTGLLTPAQALAGFGDPVVILIAALFVVGEGLSRAGLAARAGARLARAAGGDETRLLAYMMVAVALLSALMSSTGAVAVFIPVVMGMAARHGLSARRLLMPLAFAALIGGMLTLIGTPPNLIVSAQLQKAGLAPFGFFDFTPAGLAVLAVGMAFLLLAGRRLLDGDKAPAPSTPRLRLLDLLAAYDLTGRLFLAQPLAGGSVLGTTLRDSRLYSRFGATVIALRRAADGSFAPARPDTIPRGGDTLLVAAAPEAAQRMAEIEALSLSRLETASDAALERMRAEYGAAEAVVTPGGALVGADVRVAAAHAGPGVFVLAARRRGERLDMRPDEARLAPGDMLLLAGRWAALAALNERPGALTVLRTPAEFHDAPPVAQHAGRALAILLAMLAGLAFQLAPATAVALAAAVAMVAAGCVPARKVYTAVHWPAVVLIAGMIPMATALQTSGGAALLVDALMAAVGQAGPLAVLAGLMATTSALSQVISNTATTVLVAPIAIGAAQAMGVSPYPMAMGVAIAASTAFATPIASPVNTLVLGPGGYRFRDFLRVGLPMQALALAAALIAAPIVAPF